MKRTLILPLVLLVVALGIGFKLAGNKQKINAAKQPIDRSGFAIPVNVISTAMAKEGSDFSVPGTLSPFEHAKVMLQAQGKLTVLNVDLGSRVSKGQVIGSLDVASKKLELDAAELQLEKLRKDHERYKDLLAGKATSEASYDDIKFNFENQKVTVDRIRQQIRDAQLVSPVNGTVVAKNVEVGEYVGVNTAVVEVVDVSRLKAKVFVSENDAYRVNMGDAVSISSSVFPGETFAGKVTFVSPQGDASHNYAVEVAVENSKAHALKSGTYVNVRFTTADAPAMLAIPKNALGEGVKDPYVYVVQQADSSARVQRRALVLGREIGDRVEVLNGLQVNETVVVSGQLNLTEGSLVRVTGRSGS